MVKFSSLKTKRTRKGIYGLPAIVLLVLGMLLSACGEQATPVNLTLATTAPATTAPGVSTGAATSAASNGTSGAVTTSAATATTAASSYAVATTAASAATATIVPATTPAATTSAAGVTTSAPLTVTVPVSNSTVPTVQVPDAARQVIATISKQTEKSRNLTFKTPVETNFMTRADLAKYQTEEFNKNNPPENIKRDEKILKVFGLAPKTFDYAKTFIDLQNEQVIGFYDTITKKLYIVTDTDPSKVDALAKFTAEHELTHALQDQYFELQKFLPDRKPEDQEWSDDAQSARLALVEGDAVQSQLTWLSAGNLSQADLAELIKSSQSSSSNVLDSAPLILSQGLLFPYEEGQLFAKSLYDKGGWSMVNKAFTDYPPKSTSQILHSAKYFNKVEPVKLDMPSMVDVLGSGWKSLDINTNGELATRIWLQTGMAKPKDEATRTQAANAVKGWSGDRYQALENTQGQDGFVWRTQWDSEGEATDFFNAASTSMKGLFNLTGNPTGTDLKKSWTTADQDVSLIRKGNQVLVTVLPKGSGIEKVTAKLGF